MEEENVKTNKRKTEEEEDKEDKEPNKEPRRKKKRTRPNLKISIYKDLIRDNRIAKRVVEKEEETWFSDTNDGAPVPSPKDWLSGLYDLRYQKKMEYRLTADFFIEHATLIGPKSALPIILEYLLDKVKMYYINYRVFNNDEEMNAANPSGIDPNVKWLEIATQGDLKENSDCSYCVSRIRSKKNDVEYYITFEFPKIEHTSREFIGFGSIVCVTPKTVQCVSFRGFYTGKEATTIDDKGEDMTVVRMAFPFEVDIQNELVEDNIIGFDPFEPFSPPSSPVYYGRTPPSYSPKSPDYAPTSTMIDDL
jgi:hypothetical protein